MFIKPGTTKAQRQVQVRGHGDICFDYTFSRYFGYASGQGQGSLKVLNVLTRFREFRGGKAPAQTQMETG